MGGRSYLWVKEQLHRTIVERQTRLTILVKVDGKKTDLVVPALAHQMIELPSRLKQSLTWDRGTELASHQKFTVATDIDVYFCDPSSPWQRGTNENTNGLLRQYFPKGSCLSNDSQEQLEKVANQLNNRPQKNRASCPRLAGYSKCCSGRLDPSLLEID